MKVTGRCHCGQITYEAEVDPRAVAVCHCADCQMLTGSAFRMNVPAAAGQFRLLSGEPRRYVKTADSGARRVHAFCGDCGSPVYSSAEVDPRHYALRVGALAERHALEAPVRQIWKQRSLAWVAPLDSPEVFEGQP